MTTPGPVLPVSDRAQLLAALRASGLTAAAYARTVLIREPRTVRRWLAGQAPIPQTVRAFLARTATPEVTYGVQSDD